MSETIMLDLNQFDTLSPHEAGFEVLLNLPNGEPAFLDVDAKKPNKRLSITVKGSKASVARNISLRELREYQKAKVEFDKDGSVAKEETYEEMAEKAARKMADVVISWKNIPAWDGKGELAFTKEDAYKLFLNYESIRSQVIKAHENDENFIKG